jgi:hypothetical protein
LKRPYINDFFAVKKSPKAAIQPFDLSNAKLKPQPPAEAEALFLLTICLCER